MNIFPNDTIIPSIQPLIYPPPFKLTKHWEIIKREKKWLLKRWTTSTVYTVGYTSHVTFEEFDTETDAINVWVLEKLAE